MGGEVGLGRVLAVLIVGQCLGEAEVEHLHRAVASDLDVGRLEVPVDDAEVMGGLDACGDLLRDAQRLVERYRPLDEAIREGRPLHQLEDEGGDAAGCFEAVDAPDVRMVEGRERSRLAFESGDTRRIGDERVRQDLEGDVTSKPRVTRAIHDTHPAGAKCGQHLVGPETTAGTERHQMGRV